MTICHLYHHFGTTEGNTFREVEIQITEGEQMSQIIVVVM